MRRLLLLLEGSPLERASWLRHLSLVVAVIAAWAMRHALALTDPVFWIFGLAAALNLATMFLSGVPSWAGVGRWLSSIFGIAGWATLSYLTGGIGSPFIAGLGLEIIFSAVVFPPTGTLLVTAAAVATLWLQPTWASAEGRDERVWLQTGFVALVGAFTFYASRYWVLAQRGLSLRANQLGQRLADLEHELDQARKLGQVAEGVARVAHGLKNAVHSLRGFTSLIEAPGGNRDVQHKAIQGLRLAIDRLEEIARTTLHPPADASGRAGAWTSAAEVDRTLDEVMEEVGRRHHGVRWVKVLADGLAGVALSRSILREVLLVLVENAAEASGAAGEVLLRVHREQGMFKLMVRDRGPGIAPDLDGKLFALGATTKADGNGYGLFLARRLVESRGGRLIAAPASGGGALFSVTLPLEGN